MDRVIQTEEYLMSFQEQPDMFNPYQVYEPRVKPIPGHETDKKGRPRDIIMTFGKYWVHYSMDRRYKPWRFVTINSCEFDEETDVPPGTIERMRSMARTLLLMPKVTSTWKTELEKAGQMTLF